MPAWSLAIGIALIVTGFALQFGSYLRRPRDFSWVLTGIRLRSIGLGVLLLGLGLEQILSSLLSGFEIGSLLVGIFVMAVAGTWCYAASDKIFSVGSAPLPGSPNSNGSQDGQTHGRH